MAFKDLREEGELAERYAAVTHTHVIQNKSQLDPKDQALDEMRDWCMGEGNIVVLKSGNILSVDPTARQVQNCKSLMLTKGIYPGQVFASTHKMIASLLMIRAEEKGVETYLEAEAPRTVSLQQKQLRELLSEALRRKVRRIHIQVRETSTQIRMRQQGVLQIYGEWSEKLGEELAALVFHKKENTPFNPLLPQEAALTLNLQGRDLRLFSKSVPAQDGFDFVMNLLTLRDERGLLLEELGYTEGQAQIIKSAMAFPSGIILIAGPEGSGKSTTLASCLGLVRETEKIYSLEESQENVIARATQVPVHHDRTLASMGRIVLNMDPDVISLSEISDEESARLLVSACLRGHLVLSTLCASRALSIITRLRELNLSSSVLSDQAVLRGLSCQHLVVKLCPSCAIPLLKSKEQEARRPSLEKALGSGVLEKARVRGPGCNQCHYSGADGQMAMAEVIYVDEEGRNFILKNDLFGWEAYLQSKGFKSLFDRAVDLISQGVLDPLDAERTIGPLNRSFQDKNFIYN